VRRPPAQPPQAPRRPPPYTPGYYEEPPPKRRRWLPWLLVALLLAAAGFAGWYVFSQIQDQLAANQPVAVPNVVGLKEDPAVKLIEGAGFDANVEHAANPDIPKGTVMSQNPHAGTRIQKGDQVTLIVSTGPPQVEVPNVVGMDYADAVQALSNAKLKAEKEEVFSSKPADRVLKQDPPAGENVNEGTTVTLRVSKGKEMVSVPNVVGMSEADAKATLQQQGFQVQTQQASSDTTPEGNVSAQDPAGGSQAAKGSVVTITVSTGPSTTTVPNEVGQEKQIAEEDLRNAGFHVKVEYIDVADPNQENIVQSQNPTGGSQAPRGSKVTIVVGKFKAP
jgi:beta-lactam-binding protein with PASTA domain